MINYDAWEKAAKVNPNNNYSNIHFEEDAKNTKLENKVLITRLTAHHDGNDKISIATTEKAKIRHNLGVVILENGFKIVARKAFKDNENIEGFIACDTLEDICDTAFSGATNLKKVILNYGIKTISGDAFANCISLGGIWLPETLEYVSDTAFVRSGLRVVICEDKHLELVEKLKSVSISKIFVIDENSLVKDVIFKQSLRNDIDDEIAMENIRGAIMDLIDINEANREILQPLIDSLPRFKAGDLKDLQTKKPSRKASDTTAAR